MKRIVLVPMAVLILCACEDATQPVGVDEPSVLLSKVSDARCIDLPDGNVSWWPGDGHIFDVGDVNHGFPTSDLEFTPGMVGDAFSFDGVDDAIEAGGENIDELQELTIDAWVKLHSLPDRIERFVTLSGEKAVLRYDGIDGTRQLHFYMNIEDELWHVRVNNVLQAGVFHHVAGTYDGSDMRLYLDGVEVGSHPISGTVGPGYGVELSSQVETLDGLLDEVEIYDQALSASEILAIYEAGSAGKCKATPIAPCPEAVDVFVGEDEERLRLALEAARPGDVLGLDGFLEVTDEVVVGVDELTLTCATPGSGLYGDGSFFDLVWITGDGVRVEHLKFEAGAGLSAAIVAGSSGGGDYPVVANNTFECRSETCVWSYSSMGPTIVNNYFDISTADEVFSAIQIGNGTTESHVEGNTIVGPIDSGRSGIRIRSGSNHMVIGNKVSGPWDESISAGVGSSGEAPRDNLFRSNRLEGATGSGLELWGEVCDWIAEDIDTGETDDECHVFEPATDNVVRNNRISGAGEAGIIVNAACRNTFVGNNLQGNADDIGIIFPGVTTLDFVEEGLYYFGTEDGTGANTFVGNGNIVIDDGDLDCDGDGEPDPNIINGAGAVLHGVNLGRRVSDAMPSKKDGNDLTLH